MNRFNKKYFCVLAVILIAIVGCRKYNELSEEQFDKRLAGGINTSFDAGSGAYGNPFPTLEGYDSRVHDVGDQNFEATYVTAPAPIHSGLGPIFNNVSCASCHIGDGRGRAPYPGEHLSSLLFRLSIPGADEHNGPLAVDNFGKQLQPFATFGKQAEADVQITYTDVVETFDDGEQITLRKPTYQLISTYTTIPSNVLISPRVALPVIGLGLLEAIDEGTLLAKVDENDADGDGVSGKANYVWNYKENRKMMGRFGWKASSPTVQQQVALAFNEDIGITNSIFRNENCQTQTQYDNLQDDVELTDSVLNAVAFYLKTLSVPARRNVTNEVVVRGETIFKEAGCVKCHTPYMRTAVNVAFKQVSNQLIFPYSDLLLHNMGLGLADNRPDYDADGYEWRTPPLWGTGLTQIVNGHQTFLHDGRARNLAEAIMWHNGEAYNARQYFKALSKSDREAVIYFLNSL